MKTRTMMKVLIATVTTVGLYSAVMADSAGHNFDVAAPKVTGKPKPVDECVFVRQMKYADATDVKDYIATLIIEEQKKVVVGCEANAVGVNGGMIRGKLVVIADEDTNKLIIVTSKPNMDFLDQVIEQLDVEERERQCGKKGRKRK